MNHRVRVEMTPFPDALSNPLQGFFVPILATLSSVDLDFLVSKGRMF